jgi:hypothetical protein
VAFSEGCKKYGGDVAKYMGTYPSAVDHYTVMKMENRTKLSFWGISSGTHLGQTIAQLYPEAVDKFWLDCEHAFPYEFIRIKPLTRCVAVVPSELAYTVSSANPLTIKDAEKSLDAFFYTCLHAGPANCSFAGASTTTAELKARYLAIDESLKTHPIPVAGSPKPFDWSVWRNFLSLALHSGPYFPVLGGVLAEAEIGMALGWIPYVMFNITLVPPPPLPLTDLSTPFEGTLSGVCIDEKHHLHSKSQFVNYYNEMVAAAPSVAFLFSDWRLVCSKWKIDPANRFPKDVKDKVSTSGGFLLVNNVGDPSCSLDGAKLMAERFSPSYLVKNNAVGHTTFSASGPCLFATVYQFFVLGITPAAGANCSEIDPTMAPFGLQLPADF